MGYFIDFTGDLTVEPALQGDIKELVDGLSRTRRMKRDIEVLKEMGFDGFYGIEGEFFVEGKGVLGQDKDSSVSNDNTPPITQPGLWCHWKVDGTGTKFTPNSEQFYHSADWMKYLIERILKPNGYTVNGIIDGIWHKGKFTISVENNEVQVTGIYDYACDDTLWDEQRVLSKHEMIKNEAVHEVAVDK